MHLKRKKYLQKKQGPTETRTRIKGFRVLCANHYTIEPPENYNVSGFYLPYPNTNENHYIKYIIEKIRYFNNSFFYNNYI